jgi:hypothetical protein
LLIFNACCPALIKDYKIRKYRFYGTSYELIIEINLKDKSQLYVRDYLFDDGKRKYSFHWQNSMKECINRWDNISHYQNIKTFPFHKHVGKNEMIEESEVMNLEKVLEFISQQIID